MDAMKGAKQLTIGGPDSLTELAAEGQLEGWISGMPATWYHAGPGIGSSGLRKVLQTPAHFKADQSSPKEETDALRLGTAVHTSVLEPTLFDEQYCIKPIGTDRRTKDGKASYEKWTAANIGKVQLHHEEAAMIKHVTASANAHSKFSKMLAVGLKELTVYAAGEGQVICRVRPDLYIPNLGVIVDLKTTTDASPKAFADSMAWHGYDVQAAYYMDVMHSVGLKVKSFVFAVVEKSPPYPMVLYYLKEKTLAVGRKRYQSALTKYGDCLEVDVWPAYSTDIMAIDAPNWYLSQHQTEGDL